jgi:hypothetical protein
VERRAAHALALPFLGRGTKEALMSTLKLAGLAAGGLVAVAAVVVGLAVISDGGEADDGVVAVIEGIEVTEEEWAEALALPGGEEVVACSLEALDREGRDTADAREDREFLGRHAQLYASHSRAAAVLIEVIEDRAIEALAVEKGLEPTNEQVAAAEAEFRGTVDRLRGTPFPSGRPPCFLEEVEAAINRVGEDRYWNEIVPEQERHSLREQNLWEAGHLGLVNGVYVFELARSANVELRPALEDVVTLEEAYAFRDEYRQLQEAILAESQQQLQPTPTP